MNFWGCEIGPGKGLSVDIEEGCYIHLTQLALTPNGKQGERATLQITIEGNTHVIGTLTRGTCDQMQLDLVLEREFTFAHNGTSTLHALGYMTKEDHLNYGEDDEDLTDEEQELDEDEDEEESEEDEETPAKQTIKANGSGRAVADAKAQQKPAAKAKKEEPDKFEKMVQAKANSFDMPSKSKKVVQKQPVMDADDSDDDDVEEGDFDNDEEDDEEDDEDEEMDDEDEEDNEDDDDDDDEDEEEEKVVTVKAGKRPAEVQAKVTASAKKVKVEATATPTPKKPGKDVKATPTPAKPAAKSEQPKSAAKSEAPKSAAKGKTTPGKKLGDFKCDDCDRAFASESAVKQHAVSKHGKK